MPRIEPPYYAVIITTVPSGDDEGYANMAGRMTELGEAQPGYLGRRSLTGADGEELTVFYYRDEASVRAWKAHPKHLVAQRLGRERWYSQYTVEVCRVERRYEFDAASGTTAH